MFSVRNKKIRKIIFELPVSSIHPLIWSSVKLIIYLFKVIICCLLGSTITIAKLSLLLLLCSHSPNDVPPPRTSAERIHSRDTGRRASVH